MRSFEFVAGGSAKFWEIERAGRDVSVRFGRIGTQGQTSVKSLPDEAAAITHETNLINDKLRKGYVETSAPIPSAAAPAAPPVPSGPVAAAAPPSPSGSIATAAPAADDDVLVIPPAWLRHRAARRGSTGLSRFAPSAKARAAVEAKIALNPGRVRKILGAPTTPAPIRLAARAYLGAAADATPLGAAAVAAVAESARWDDSSAADAFVDVWIRERGLVFAAEAVVTMASLVIVDDRKHTSQRLDTDQGVRHRRPHEVGRAWQGSLLRMVLRVRQALATASDSDHAAVVAALRPLRAEHPCTRAATAVLVPEQREWIAEETAAAVATGDSFLAGALLSAVSTEADVRALYPVANEYMLVFSLAPLLTLLDGAGPAAAPALFHWFDEAFDDAESKRRLLSVLALIPGDEVTRGLIERISVRHVTPALLEHADRFPARVLRLLAEHPGARAVDDLLRGHLLKHRDLADRVVPDLSPAAADRIGRILADEAAAVPPAPLSAVPALLADPPWKHVTPPAKPIVISGLTCDDPATLDWPAGERERWSQTRIHRDGGAREWATHASRMAVTRLDAREAAILFLDAPEETARQAMRDWQPGNVWDAGSHMRPVAARYGLDALPALLRLARRGPSEMADMMLPFAAPEVAVLAADWLARLKSLRETALEWLLRHPVVAARALIPPALGKIGTARRQAENALLALHANGHTATVRAAAESYGEAVSAAVEPLLATDPAAILPTRIPEAPAWATAGLLRPVLLRDGSGTLPDEAVTNLVVALAMSRLDTPYPGLDLVRDACEPSSLAEFAWSLFEQWQAAGANAKENWALDALGLLGDDETVRRLFPLILAWPGESGHNKAVTGLRVLTTIGSDVALMHLYGIAQRSRFTGLKNAAREKMAEVADALGLTAEQLADRLVPDFGLDADGSLRLDYGPRQFVVGFDEQLKPFVTDSAGKRLKALPKPGAKDDPELAPAACQRFTALKKDVRTVATDQVRRLEQAMVTNRRWTGAEFRRLFIEHPLLWHIVRRLVWVRFTAPGGPERGRLVPGEAFRIAEDRSLSTVDDEVTTLADDAVVGVAHPLHLGEAAAAWAEVFADYEILQPFAQLGRPTFAFTERERRVSRLARFQGIKVPSGRLLSMERRGWRRETPQDAGVQSRLEFAAGPGREIIIAIEPGIAVGVPDMFPEQELTEIFLHDGTAPRWGRTGDRGHVSLGDLDPITASEILRDLTELTTP
ncbi:DUF4132 domain-containing protein [Actinoplanes utahensis]|nr:hypothetical protein Aut01nite_26100 [Actinoplanes utahensis]